MWRSPGTFLASGKVDEAEAVLLSGREQAPG
jgi:hypothetical protein